MPCETCDALVSVRHACADARARTRKKGKEESRAKVRAGDGCARCKGMKYPARFRAQQMKVAGLVEAGEATLVAPPHRVEDKHECVLGVGSVARVIAVARGASRRA